MTDSGGHLPLEQYGALGDGRSVALVGADGSIDWWCVPGMGSPPLFDRLLDADGGGFFAIRPCGDHKVTRHYRRDSNVLETVFTTKSGTARLVESLNSSLAGRLPWSKLARRLEGVDSRVVFKVVLRLSSVSPRSERNPNGDVLHVGTVVAMLHCSPNVQLTHADDGGMRARVVVSAGDRALLALVAVDDEPLVVPAVSAIDGRIECSDEAWRRWTQALAYDGG